MQRLSPQDLMTLWPDEVGQWQDMGALVLLGAPPEGRDGHDSGRDHGGGDHRGGDHGRRDEHAWLADVQSMVAARLDRAPRLRQVLLVPPAPLGRPLWVDSQSFDVRDHVRLRPLSPPCDERALLDDVELLRRRRLDPALPLWQLWLLTGRSDGPRAAYLRVHHALADGPAAVTMLLASFFDVLDVLDVEADPPAAAATASSTSTGSATADRVRPTWPWVPTPPPSSPELFRDNAARSRSALTSARAAAARAAGDPVDLVRRAGRSAGALREALADPLPRSTLTRPIGPRRRLAVVRSELRRIAATAHASGGTVNDALLSAVAGGLRDLLLERGEGTGGIAPRAIVPVALPHAPGESAQGNRLGQIIVPLPVDVADPSQRLRLITARTAHAKTRATPRRPPVLRGAPLQRAAMRLARHQRAYSIYVADVQGPRTPLHLLDAPALEIFPVVPLMGNVTLGVGALSYAGRFAVMAVADRDACPDVEVFTTGVAATFREFGA